MSFKQVLSVVGAFIISVGTIAGMFYAVETHYAKASEVSVAIEELQTDIQYVSSRFDVMRLEDELVIVKKDIASMEDRWGKVFYERFDRYWQTKEELKGVMPTEYKEDYDDLQDDKVRLEKAIEEKNKKKESV